MALVTLTTDWGFSSFYTGAVKGTLLNLIPGLTIVDISHQIPCYNILHASFVLRNAYSCFPEGTIHIIGVNTEASVKSPHIVVKHNGHYFIGADNGIFSLLFDTTSLVAVELELMQDSDYFTFSSRDVFSKAASIIAQTGGIEQLGRAYTHINERVHIRPLTHESLIVGNVIFIDDYQNVFVNIDKSIFKKVAKGRPFRVNLRSKDQHLTKISRAYGDVPEGEVVVLFGTTGFLEIAINKGRAASLLGFQLHDTVSIDFY